MNPFYDFLTVFLMVDLCLIIMTAVVVWFRIMRVRTFIIEMLFVVSLAVKCSLVMAYLDGVSLSERTLAFLNLPKWVHLVWPIILLLHSLSVCVREYVIHSYSISKNSIQVAVNELDSGLMYVTKKGYIVLMNRRMEKLAKKMTGSIPANGNDFWLKLISFVKNDEAKRIDMLDGPSFSFANGEVWAFTKNIVSDADATYTEIIAKNVTDLYNRRAEIEIENRKLEKLERELGVVLRNISETSNAEELLNYKIRIHDQLGNAILRTRKTIRDGQFSKDNVAEILTGWENTIKAFENNIVVATTKGNEEFKKVQKQATELGITLNISGDIPEDNPLITRCIREAMYNSIRHAYANIINVVGVRNENGLLMTISDDGIFNGKSVVEGGGLGSLRREIERNGGYMEVSIEKGIVLKLMFKGEWLNEQYS